MLCTVLGGAQSVNDWWHLRAICALEPSSISCSTSSLLLPFLRHLKANESNQHLQDYPNVRYTVRLSMRYTYRSTLSRSVLPLYLSTHRRYRRIWPRSRPASDTSSSSGQRSRVLCLPFGPFGQLQQLRLRMNSRRLQLRDYAVAGLRRRFGHRLGRVVSGRVPWRILLSQRPWKKEFISTENWVKSKWRLRTELSMQLSIVYVKIFVSVAFMEK